MIVYRGIGREVGSILTEEEAFDYALERCLKGTEEDQEDFRKELVEWFFSGNWIDEERSGL